MITTQNRITVSATIHAPVEKVWMFWTDPGHIVHWNHASFDWHTSKAENDLKTGGKFSYRMEARDGSMGFDFSGEYTEVLLLKRIKFRLDDGRKVQILFEANGEESLLTETFEAETMNSLELQKQGWQAILDNFKNYVEKSGSQTQTKVI
ncbi:MAG: SRPBCC family protein [Bacteroidales bacterium]